MRSADFGRGKAAVSLLVTGGVLLSVVSGGIVRVR